MKHTGHTRLEFKTVFDNTELAGNDVKYYLRNYSQSYVIYNISQYT